MHTNLKFDHISKNMIGIITSNSKIEGTFYAIKNTIFVSKKVKKNRFTKGS